MESSHKPQELPSLSRRGNRNRQEASSAFRASNRSGNSKKRYGEDEKEAQGIKWGPLLIFGFILGLGVVGFIVSISFAGKDAKGYYWCVDQATELYRKYNKDKIAKVPQLCEKYRGREEIFIKRLVAKYRG